MYARFERHLFELGNEINFFAASIYFLATAARRSSQKVFLEKPIWVLSMSRPFSFNR
jgi:hypothetical protein